MKIILSLLAMAGLTTGVMMQQQDEGSASGAAVSQSSESEGVSVAVGGAETTAVQEAPATSVQASSGSRQSHAAASGLFSVSPIPMTQEQRDAETALRKAHDLLQKAETDDEKDDARRELRSALGDVYDERLNAYRDHLDKLKESIRKMEKQIEQRADVRDELVDLRLKMMVHEAEGLGWPYKSPPGLFGGYRPYGYGGGGGGVFAVPSEGTFVVPPEVDQPAIHAVPAVKDGGR